MLTAIKRLFIGTLTLVFPSGIFLTTGVGVAKADYLVQNAKITTVQNTSSNNDNYAVGVSGGTGPCINQIIIFPASGVLNREIHSRGYQAALTALTQGYTVSIYDYSGTSCSNGGQIAISK
ncbi:MAG: DUF5992 family protein [Nostoc sp.]|uniref:DUF5992 family protein n=1 Tax=Nostoc sp. TaxID=1180 RepID=UPI002FF42C97